MFCKLVYLPLKHKAKNMKKILLFGAALFLYAHSNAQIFSDNFDSYEAGDYIVSSNPTKWATWSGGAGGTSEDTKITDAEFKSAPNSLAFSSSSANGGPTDIILKFDEVYDVGTFTLEFNVKVAANKGGYFNLQQNHTVGQVWAMDCYLINNGKLKITGGSSGVDLLETTYPNGDWFNLKLEVDLTTNVWEVFVDGTSAGTFSNPVNSIGILDFYPVNPAGVGGNNQSEFYIDDISYNHTIPNLPELNAGMNLIKQIDGIAGQSIPVTARIRNLGTKAITSYDLTYEYDGVTKTQTVSGVNIASLGFNEITFTDPIVLAVGNKDLKVTVSNVNGAGQDANAADDAKSITIKPIIPAEGKIVVGEEATGTWCVWCPRGAVFMDYMQEKYAGFWAGIAVHNNDPMVNAAYDNGIGTKIEGYPSAIVDRGPAIDPSALEEDFKTRITKTPKAVLVNGAEFEPNSRILDVTVTYTFNSKKTGGWRAAVALTEDGVTGTASGYAQKNAYAGGSAGEMGGYENLPNPVPADQMVYDHVARTIAPSFKGDNTLFPSTIEAGESYTVCYSFYLLDEWDETKMNIVGMLIDQSGKIDNGSFTTIAEALDNGLVECDAVGATSVKELDKETGFNLYPNPATDIAFVDVTNQTGEEIVLTISDLSGKVIATRTYSDVNGSVNLPINTGNFANGTYIVTLQANGTIQQKKLIVQ